MTEAQVNMQWQEMLTAAKAGNLFAKFEKQVIAQTLVNVCVRLYDIGFKTGASQVARMRMLIESLGMQDQITVHQVGEVGDRPIIKFEWVESLTIEGAIEGALDILQETA